MLALLALGSVACQFPRPADKEADADTGPMSRTITITVEAADGEGSVAMAPGQLRCSTTCQTELLDGTSATFTASEGADTGFIGWRQDGAECGNETSCVRTVSGSPLAITASFARHGSAAWALRFGSPSEELRAKVGVDGSGYVFLASSYRDNAELGSEPVTHLDYVDFVLTKRHPTGDEIWTRTIAGAGYQEIEALAVHPGSGDVAILGSYSARTQLGDDGASAPLEIWPGDTKDFFIARFDGDTGTLLWQLPIHASDADDPGIDGLAFTPQGDLTVSGSFHTLISIGDKPLTNSGSVEGFVAKLAGKDGQPIWLRKLGCNGIGGLFLPRVAVDRDGDVYVAGTFEGTCNFGASPMTANGLADAVTARLDGRTGQLVWQRQIGGSGSDTASTVLVDVNRTVFVGVTYQVMPGEAVRFAGQVVEGTGAKTDSVIGALTYTNQFAWAQRFGGSENESTSGLARLQDGTVVAFGTFASSMVSIGTTLLIHRGEGDVFIARLTPTTGAANWAAAIGGTGFELADTVSAWRSTIVLGGHFQNQINAFGRPLVSIGGRDAFVVLSQLGPG